jgi:hypothetical protein
MLEAPDIRGDVSPSMHPTSLAAHARALDVAGTMGQHVYTDAHTALTVAYTCMGNLRDVRKQVEKQYRTRREVVQNGQVTHAVAYPEQFFAGVDRAMERASRQIDSADAGIRAKITSLASRVETMLSDPSAKTPVAAEIRAHAKGLTDTKRMAFIRDAINVKDKASVAALLSAPAYLSGLSTEQADVARKMAEETFAQVESAQLHAAEKVLERVREAGAQLVGYYGEITALRDTPEARARAAMDKLGT